MSEGKAYRTLEELNKITAIGVVEDSGVDSSNKYIKVFPGKIDYSTVDSICNGRASQSSGSKSTTNSNVISVANIGSGYVSGNFRVGELVNISGPGGFISFGIPSSGIVGNQPYMVMDSHSLYGGVGGSDDPWFLVNYSGESISANGKVISGGDLFIGCSESFFMWDQSLQRVTLAGHLLIYGNIISGNWNEDWQTHPPMTGYKLAWEDGFAYFAGATITGTSTIGDRLATTIGSSINASGQFTNHVINTSLNTSTGKILGTFSVDKTTNSNVGFRAGTLTWDVDGNRTAGYGVAMTPKGLIGYNTAGTPTFSINADTGEASFRGEIRSGSSSDFIIIDGTHSYIGLYADEILQGAISIDNAAEPSTAFGLGFSYFSGASESYGVSLAVPGFNLFGTGNTGGSRIASYEINNIPGTIPEGKCGVYLNSSDGVKIKCNAESGFITFVSGLGSSSEVLISYIKVSGSNMGLYIPSSYGISLGGEYRTTWPSGGASTLNSLSIDVSKNWGGYSITNLGGLTCTGGIAASTLAATTSINLAGTVRSNWPDAISKISIDTAKDWGGYKITNLGSPTNTSDAATAGYVNNAITTVMSWVTANFVAK